MDPTGHDARESNSYQAARDNEKINDVGHGDSLDKSYLDIVKETNLFVDYINKSGSVIRVPKQSSKSIMDSISKNLNSKVDETRIEAKIGDFIQKNTNVTITDFGNKIKKTTGDTIGDIDVATEKALIEVKASIGSIKQKQLYKYIDNSDKEYINVFNKEVILYIDTPIDMSIMRNSELIKKIEAMNIKVVNNIDELKGIIK